MFYTPQLKLLTNSDSKGQGALDTSSAKVSALIKAAAAEIGKPHPAEEAQRGT